MLEPAYDYRQLKSVSNVLSPRLKNFITSGIYEVEA